MRPRSVYVRVLLLQVALFGCDASAGVPDEVGAAGEAGLFVGHRAFSIDAPGAVRARRALVLDRATVARVEPGEATDPPAALRLNLFAGAVYDARLLGTEEAGGSLVWRGEIVGRSGSAVTLSFRGDAVAGVIRVDGRVFTVQPRASGPVIVEWDEAAVPLDAPSIVPEASAPGRGSPIALPAPAGAVGAASEIDLYVAYTVAARAAAGGEDGIRATIDLAIDEANQSFERSGVPARFALLGAAEEDYDELDFDFHETLGRLVTPGDGALDGAPRARDALGADHVVLLVEHVGPYAGLGYQLTRANRPIFAEYAYSVVSRAYAAGFYTFAHELGHNMGANHDPANADDGYHADSRGHRDPDAGFRTIMAYGCEGDPCPRVGLWSSPEVAHEGTPSGVVGVSDNARTLRETAAICAAFRERVAPAAVAARIVSPRDGARLPAGAVTFTWEDAGADEYVLRVGTAPGDARHASVRAGTRTRATVTGLPATGEPVHVRLTSRFGASRLTSDHVFVSYRGAPPRARLTVPDRQLAGSWSFFAWTSVEGATAYRLEVGTLTDPSRYHAGEPVEETFAHVVGLPVDGSPVLARVWTRDSSGVWATHASVHRAWTAPSYAAHLVAPAPGAVLDGRRATFVFSETAADGHWLVLQDEHGILSSTSVASDRVTLRGLPTDGRDLWVALYSRGPDGWAATSARLRAFGARERP